MKRAVFMAFVVLSAGFAAGCERNDSTSTYDPKLDGLKPPAFKRPDESILENQRDLIAKSGGGSSSPVVTPAPAPAATTTAPSTNTAVEATTAPTSAPAVPSTGGDTMAPPSN